MKNLLFTAVISTFVCLSVSYAQQPNVPGPQNEHRWLKQFTGQWTSKSKTVASDEVPSTQCAGSMNSHMLGQFFVINDLEGEMDGVRIQAIQTIGYDTSKKKYVGTWVDSAMNYLWHYEGEVDASGKKLVLIAEGPNFMAKGQMAKFRDSYEFQSPDTIVATSEMMDNDGTWVTFMTGELTRSKP
ncbi:hypothetical protein CA13_65200 [Planctomycetes bacterium CA13]|uniref:DUF1579 domain-containing protein n=1 Tax=Novipirellula herctigrandis TaxID=2527986 RepID=A0A5C5ZD09_9BACT|nr:hypothetical protein CA13_65200 [Planctomycetes bacterium CA13]